MSALGSLLVGEPQFFDNAGAPLSGGKVYCYTAGTLTPQDTYTTATLTPGTEKTNPVVLDSAGRAVIFLAATAYKIILKTSADVVLWTVDNIVSPTYAATLATTPVVQSISTTGTANDLSLVTNCRLLRISNGTDLTITGMLAGADGQVVTLLAIGAGNVFLSHENSSSLAVDRLHNQATSAATPLSGGTGSATYQYDGTTQRWRLVSHEQGAWITYSAAYAGNGSMTFASVSATTSKYRLMGTTVDVALDVTGTVGGTPNTTLLISMPYNAVGLVPGLYNNNGTIAQSYTTAASNVLVFYKDLTLTGNFGAGSTHVLAGVRCDVT